MARYIDADILINEVLASWDKDNHKTIEASHVHRQEHHHLMRIIEKQPIADVVPKSEVEIWKQNRFNIFQSIELYEMTRQKVAREIFEDIDRCCRVCGAFGIRGYIMEDVAELKKKYTEGAEENAERCISCGEIIPEGRQVCPKCEKTTPK